MAKPELGRWSNGDGDEGIILFRWGRGPGHREVNVYLLSGEEALLREHFLAEFGLKALQQEEAS